MPSSDRVYLRSSIRKTVAIHSKENKKAFTTKTTDISTTGLGFISPHALKEGDEVEFCLKTGWIFGRIRSSGIIMRSVQSESGRGASHSVGIKFSTISDRGLRWIESYVDRQTGLIGYRRLFLILCLAGSALYLLKLAAFSVVSIYAGTEFGNEWIPSIPEFYRSPGYGIMNLFLIVTGVIFAFRIHQVKKIWTITFAVFILFGAVFQGMRLMQKFLSEAELPFVLMEGSGVLIYLLLLVLFIRTRGLKLIYQTIADFNRH